MDAFFAAIEERERPRLRGEPIVVGADPVDGKGRGVVATANYKAREYGIHSAQPISTAWRLSEQAFNKGKPRAVFIGGHKSIYSEVSRAIMNYLETKSEKLEVASIDEAYIEISKVENQKSELQIRDEKTAYAYAERLAKKIKKDILENQILTCSVGIGPNKLIAKIASDFRKPAGLTVVLPEDAQKFLDPLPVKVVPGIGPKAQTILFRLGVSRIKDLRNLSEEILKKNFGKRGEWMWACARGIDNREVLESYERKSIGEQHTFINDTLDGNVLLGEIKKMCASIYENLKKKKINFKTVAITVRFFDFKTYTRSRTLAQYTQDVKILETESLKLFLPFLDKRENPKKKLIRLLGVRVERFKN